MLSQSSKCVFGIFKDPKYVKSVHLNLNCRSIYLILLSAVRLPSIKLKITSPAIAPQGPPFHRQFMHWRRQIARR